MRKEEQTDMYGEENSGFFAVFGTRLKNQLYCVVQEREAQSDDGLLDHFPVLDQVDTLDKREEKS